MHCSLLNILILLLINDFLALPVDLLQLLSAIYLWWHFIVINVLNAFEIYVSSFVASILSDSHTGYKNILYLREQIAYES